MDYGSEVPLVARRQLKSGQVGSFALDDSSIASKGSVDRKLAVELWLMIRDPANFQTQTTLWQGIRTKVTIE